MEILISKTHQQLSAIISSYTLMQCHFSEGCLFSSEKAYDVECSKPIRKSLSEKLFSENKNRFCQSDLKEQRKSSINPWYKYADQNYRPEDSVCIYSCLSHDKKSYTCERSGAHLRISFWHLLMNLKNK